MESAGKLPAKIVSGGQTGADIGALEAARELGISSGGIAPKGWLTEEGPAKQLLEGFGLTECDEPGYPPRTRRNVASSDGTLIIGQIATGGSRLTYQIALELAKPVFLVPYAAEARDLPPADLFRAWLYGHLIRTLNVAGNRESDSAGIAEFTRRFLLRALRPQSPYG